MNPTHMRLLLPTVRHPRPRTPPRPRSPLDTASDWIGLPLHFHVVQEQLQVTGYQLYAVEKWIVERTRPVTVLTVYTGDPSHQITVTALSPSTTDPHAWERAIQHLKRDGARPKETPLGVLMATSLAHFRSDFTIVHIPQGNFLAVREQLYTNINLLRTGCSGRSALTLEEPSDTTKQRFISTYNLPDNTSSTPALLLTYPISSDNLPLAPSPSPPSKRPKHKAYPSKAQLDGADPDPIKSPSRSLSKTATASPIGRGKTKDRALFNATVLELVKLIQAGLAISGMYTSQSTVVLDGLLCDVTVEGIRKWIADVGEPCVALEPMERIADPMFVSALLSLVLAIRNKLAVMGYSHIVPKDPFLHPQVFSGALLVFIQSVAPPLPSNTNSPTINFTVTPNGSAATPPGTGTNTTNTPAPSSHGHSHSLAFYSPGSPVYFGSASVISHISNTTTTLGTSPFPQMSAVLTRELVDTISSAYEAKGRTGEGRKVRRVIKEKLDDLAGAVVGADKESDGDGRERRGSGAGSLGLSGGGGGAGTLSGGEGGASGAVTSGGGGGFGIGSLASGLGLGGGGSNGGGGPAAAVLDGTSDLPAFVKVIMGKERDRDRRGRKRERESVDVSKIGYGYGGRDKDKDGGVLTGVGGTVRGLWTGRVEGVVRLREWVAEREINLGGVEAGKKEKEVLGSGKDREKWKVPTLSDGDAEEPSRNTHNERSDGRTTEEESDPVVGGGFGAMGPWGERVQKKLELWTGGKLNRKKGNHMSLDFSMSPSKGSGLGDRFPGGKPLEQTPTAPTHGQTLSPTLPPMVFTEDADRDPEDDDLLSSGQISPIAESRPNPLIFLHDGPSVENAAAHAHLDYERRIIEFNQKRLRGTHISQSRVSSWSDPASARGILGESGDYYGEESAGGGRKGRSSQLAGGGSVLRERDPVDEIGEVEDEWEVEVESRRSLAYGARRRRSFHDLSSLRDMRVLTPERMRIDVELCGQMLIMTRREQHLLNVLACLQALTTSLSDTNAFLREDYKAHLPFISTLDTRTKIITDIDTETRKADKTSQATNTLRYESEQFRVPDLWHAASPPRQKVLTLRDKVFGTGGRRLPSGVHGAHGQFNRLQWTIDGRERLVDYLGRTESDVEEENLVDPHALFTAPPVEEDEEDVVEHPGIKPMWLLRFFTSWGAKWGATAPAKEKEGEGESPKVPPGTSSNAIRATGKTNIKPEAPPDKPSSAHSLLAT